MSEPEGGKEVKASLQHRNIAVQNCGSTFLGPQRGLGSVWPSMPSNCPYQSLRLRARNQNPVGDLLL